MNIQKLGRVGGTGFLAGLLFIQPLCARNISPSYSQIEHLRFTHSVPVESEGMIQDLFNIENNLQDASSHNEGHRIEVPSAESDTSTLLSDSTILEKIRSGVTYLPSFLWQKKTAILAVSSLLASFAWLAYSIDGVRVPLESGYLWGNFRQSLALYVAEFNSSVLNCTLVSFDNAIRIQASADGAELLKHIVKGGFTSSIISYIAIGGGVECFIPPLQGYENHALTPISSRCHTHLVRPVMNPAKVTFGSGQGIANLLADPNFSLLDENAKPIYIFHQEIHRFAAVNHIPAKDLWEAIGHYYTLRFGDHSSALVVGVRSNSVAKYDGIAKEIAMSLPIVHSEQMSISGGSNPVLPFVAANQLVLPSSDESGSIAMVYPGRQGQKVDFKKTYRVMEDYTNKKQTKMGHFRSGLCKLYDKGSSFWSGVQKLFGSLECDNAE